MNNRLSYVRSMARRAIRSDRMTDLTIALRGIGLSVIVVGDPPDNYLSVATEDREREVLVRVDVDGSMTVDHRRGNTDELAALVRRVGKRPGFVVGPDAAERPADSGGAP